MTASHPVRSPHHQRRVLSIVPGDAGAAGRCRAGVVPDQPLALGVVLIRGPSIAAAWHPMPRCRNHVPAGVPAKRECATTRPTPTRVRHPFPREGGRHRSPAHHIVWVHGGGFLAGSRTQVANYARLLPRMATPWWPWTTPSHRAQYPTPVRQLNRALALCSENADRLHIDRTRFCWPGLGRRAAAAQLAALVSSPDYANAMGLTPGIARSSWSAPCCSADRTTR